MEGLEEGCAEGCVEGCGVLSIRDAFGVSCVYLQKSLRFPRQAPEIRCGYLQTQRALLLGRLSVLRVFRSTLVSRALRTLYSLIRVVWSGAPQAGGSRGFLTPGPCGPQVWRSYKRMVRDKGTFIRPAAGASARLLPGHRLRHLAARLLSGPAPGV